MENEQEARIRKVLSESGYPTEQINEFIETVVSFGDLDTDYVGKPNDTIIKEFKYVILGEKENHKS